MGTFTKKSISTKVIRLNGKKVGTIKITRTIRVTKK